MITHKYGEFTRKQIAEQKKSIRKSIFFLLLCVDPQTQNEYPNVDVDKYFLGLLNRLGGLNSLLLEPPELVTILCSLESAYNEYQKEDFNFELCRKLILDAGALVLSIKEGE